MSQAIRAISDIADMRLDAEKKTLTMDGTAKQLALAEWLFSRLNIPVTSVRCTIVQNHTIPGDDRGSAVRIYYHANPESGRPLQEFAGCLC